MSILIPIKNRTIKAIVDQEDSYLFNYEWYLDSDGYVFCREKINGNKLMHRIILELGPYSEDKRIVDHKNHIKHDNQRSNMRICSTLQNTRNSSKKNNSTEYKGVVKVKNGWCAFIGSSYKTYNGGTFPDIILAAKRHDQLARQVSW